MPLEPQGLVHRVLQEPQAQQDPPETQGEQLVVQEPLVRQDRQEIPAVRQVHKVVQDQLVLRVHKVIRVTPGPQVIRVLPDH